MTNPTYWQTTSKKKQWAINDDRDKGVSSRKLLDTCAPFKTTEFTIEEFEQVLKKSKNNKSPGPDGIPIEFIKWLDRPPKQIDGIATARANNTAANAVLDIINECWNKNILPSEVEYAEVVTLYKQGKVENPANYRPIFLSTIWEAVPICKLLINVAPQITS